MSRKPKKNPNVEKRYRMDEPIRKNTARILFFINSILWLGYGIYVYYSMAVVNDNGTSADIATIFVFINAIVIFTSGVLLGRLEEIPYYFAAVIAVFNTILAATNLSDIFFLTSFLINLLILWQLLQLRKSYLSRS